MIDANTASEATRTGLGLGTIIAVVASWDRNKSILWAILHGFLSWIYVIYYALTDRKHLSGRTILYIISSIVFVHILFVILITIFYSRISHT